MRICRACGNSIHENELSINKGDVHIHLACSEKFGDMICDAVSKTSGVPIVKVDFGWLSDEQYSDAIKKLLG